MTDKNKTVVEVTIKLEVPEDWFHTYLDHPDAFLRDYCGYWGCLIDRKLAPDHTDDKPSVLSRLVADEESVPGKKWDAMCDIACTVYHSGGELPKHFYVLDRDVMTKAYAEGVKHFGVAFGEDHDANGVDYAIQMALFGKLVYS